MIDPSLALILVFVGLGLGAASGWLTVRLEGWWLGRRWRRHHRPKPADTPRSFTPLDGPH